MVYWRQEVFGIPLIEGSSQLCLVLCRPGEMGIVSSVPSRGFVDQKGDIVGIASEDIHPWQSQGTFYEQSTPNIWCSNYRAVKQAVRESGIASSDRRGLGFDATCSLAVRLPWEV